MTIPQIKLTQEEMCKAVSGYLKLRGIDIPAEHVDKNYSGKEAFVVTLKEPEEVKEPSPPSPDSNTSE